MLVSVGCPAGKTALSGAYVRSTDGTLLDGQAYSKFLLVQNQQNGSSVWLFVWKNTDTVAHNFAGVARAACAIVQ
jgi:hypothetical protein